MRSKFVPGKIFIFLSGLLMLWSANCLAGIEPFKSSLTYPFSSGANCTTQDDKFNNPSYTWSNITNKSVQNTVSLQVLDNVLSAAYKFTVNLQVQYYTDPTNPTPVTVNTSLTVNYDPAQGITYKGLDTYSFQGGYKIVVTVTSTSTNGGSAPPTAGVRLYNSLAIDRSYLFQPTIGIGATYVKANNNSQLNISWPAINGADEYDVEWTTINDGNPDFATINTNFNASSSPDNPTVSSALGRAFRNNSSRITTTVNNCTLSLISTDSIFLVRVRQAQYNSAGVRIAGNWDYKNSTKYAIWLLTWNEQSQNWQYSAAFAEDGKKKEVISYFDGTLRNRQTVTLNNTDNVEIAQENIYDEFGRPTASILPAPYKEPSLVPFLHYVQHFNNISTNTPYTFKNVTGTIAAACELNPDALSTTSGASRYYSPSNDFLTLNAANNYIPDALGFPLSVTQYTADNTGRIKSQGGVGLAFQPGKAGSPVLSKTTKYYYGKPEQWELDQLFANDVGYAEHYLKNMVVDPNGQISISYLNASGKTIATALTGKAPSTLDSLASYTPIGPGTKVTNIHILKPDQFVYDASALKLSATTTYLASVPGTDTLKFNIQKLINKYPGTFQICSNCYYLMNIKVSDDCGAVVASASSPVGSATANCADSTLYTGSMIVPVQEIGEYNVNIEFAFDSNVIQAYADTFITKGVQHGYIEQQFNYIKKRYLDSLDVSGCYSDCHTCETTLGSQTAFVQAMQSKITDLGVDTTGSLFKTWATGLYTRLKFKCDSMQSTCNYGSPCDPMQALMLTDVSPGGQFALFDSNGTAIEPATNVLNVNWRTVFPIYPPTDPRYIANEFTLPDGTILSPNASSFTLANLVAYWQPGWDMKFLIYHPEYCQLNFCNNNAQYQEWELRVQNDINKAVDVPLIPGGASLSYSYTNSSDWLLAADPFFKTGAPANAYLASMQADLLNYSTRVLNISAAGDSVKGLIAFNDYTLYCQDKTGNTNTSLPVDNTWNSCTPNVSCRVPDREWVAYRDAYLELRDKYYNLLQNAACGSNCPVGQPINVALPGACPPITEFSIKPYTGTPTCTGAQTVVLTHDPGTLTQLMTLIIYYPSNYDNGSLTHSVVINAGQSQATFCIPTGIPVNLVKVSAAYCGAAPVYGNDPTYKVVVTDAPGGTLSNECGSSLFVVWTTTIQLQTSAGVPVNAVSPVRVDVNHTLTNCNTGTPSVAIDPITIPAGQSQATDVYVKQISNDKPCTLSCRDDVHCISAIYNVSNVTGISTCTGFIVDNPQPPVPACPVAYTTKISRFPTTGGMVAGNLSNITDGSQLTGPANTAIQAQAGDICAANADTWISRLQVGLDSIHATSTQISQLRAAFISICSAGGDINHPMGASSLPPGGSGTYQNFGVAIKGIILGDTTKKFTPSLNPWLIDAPYPYNPRQQSTARVISYADKGICHLLDSLHTNATTAGKTLYNYLVSNYGDAMTLSQAQLDTLQKGCSTCKYILAGDITLPVFLDTLTKGCITRTRYNAVKSNISAKFGGGLTSANANYQTIISNYLNQNFGYSLTYDDYVAFEGGTSPQLCNTLPYTSVEPDPYDCVKTAVAGAVISGEFAYDAYIAVQRQNFISSYISTCKLAKANANFIGVQQEYHYTLYYYDQADNLVRTVPPEGVNLVDSAFFSYIDKARDLDTAAYSYNYNGPETASNLTTAMTTLSATLSASSGAVEMWLYNAGMNHYHWVEVTPDKKYLFQVGLAGSQLAIDVYPLTQPDAGSLKFVPTSGHYTANISAQLPLLPFTHVVFQGSALGAATSLPQLYLNGRALTVSKTAGASPFGFTVTAAATVILPDSIQSLKHLRLYNHTLSTSTITADANNQFFSATDLTYLGWYRFNVPAVGAPPTTINNTTSDETAIYDTYPTHGLPTTYAYNSTNQVNTQRSPDGGTNRFWYDLLSRLVVSQNDKQLAANNYSYTLYDVLGRITEVGQKNLASAGLGSPDYLGTATLQTFNAGGTNSQITDTYYDKPVPTVSGNANGIATLPGQSFLRKRVAASTYTETQGGPALRATYYNYDLDGNVKTLWQQIDGLYQNSTNTGLKRIDYEYDLVSGKVNFVRYQDGQPDAFYYSYDYDAENRLTAAWSGTKALVDTLTGSYLPQPFARMDAHYDYYLHGPLRRMELGDTTGKVQGIDYAYTLQGWLKGVNSINLLPTSDIGHDGSAANKPPRDAYGYSLGYYDGDYAPIGGATSYPAFNVKYVSATGDITGQSLYNGNISNSTLAVSGINSGALVGYTYRYDQLNRLKKMRQHTGISGTTWNRSSITPNYQENATYDGNGNILTYGRNGAAPTAQTIDSLTYIYTRDAHGKLTTNKLQYIQDAVANSNYTGDITNQTSTTNYRYDAIGDLIYDAQSGITGNDGVNAITWSVYGKIQSIYKTTGTISYTYDPSGQRVSKTAGGLTTYYVRDAQGNSLAVYDNAHSTINWKEQQLYGSSRLGLWKPDATLTVNNAIAIWDTTGNKQYELDNHLGNVLETISDKRLQHTTNGTSVDYYLADISTAQDYYPFGMLMPGRQSSTANYRYGFNGKENDNEVKGVGEQQDYGKRIYDPRVGKFLSVDPIGNQYPWYTPYSFAGNNPVLNLDLDGEEEYHFTMTLDKQGNTQLISSSPAKIYNEHSFFGFHFKTKIEGQRFVINYNGNTYHIGFSSYASNNFRRDLFKQFLKTPNTEFLVSNFQTDEESNGQAKIAAWQTSAVMAFSMSGHIAGNPVPENLPNSENVSDEVHTAINKIEIANIEQTLGKQLVAEESAIPNAHFVSRHGAGTTLGEQYTRATTGVTPDNVIGKPVNSSRFLSNELQFDALEKAKQIYKATGQASFTFDMGKTVGEGYLKGGNNGNVTITSDVQAVFKNGKPYTLYPDLGKGTTPTP